MHTVQPFKVQCAIRIIEVSLLTQFRAEKYLLLTYFIFACYPLVYCLAVVMINTSEVVTTSQDQMLTVWGLNLLEDGGADMHMLETQFIHVPDPSTMDTIVMREEQRPLVAIAGIGVQLFDIQK